MASKKNLSLKDKKRFYLTLSFPQLLGEVGISTSVPFQEPVAVASKGRSLHHSG
jgi:hypothetical protein